MLKKFTWKDYGIFTMSIIMITYALWYNQTIQEQNKIYFPRPLSNEDLKKYENKDVRAVIVYPIFTQNAYKKGGFYDYFNGTCSKCNTVSMRPFILNATYTEGLGGFQYLTQLHYPFITDIMVDRHPEILNDYDKVILLHNEYVTKTEFDAIKNHKNVIYLYPNSLYAEISVDYNNLTISLVKGHGYPEKSISNGFGYVTSSKNEYNLQCKGYKWEAMPNGITPTCWPEFLIRSDRSVLGVIKDFPQTLPNMITPPKELVNMSKMCAYDYFGKCTLKFGN